MVFMRETNLHNLAQVLIFCPSITQNGLMDYPGLTLLKQEQLFSLRCAHIWVEQHLTSNAADGDKTSLFFSPIPRIQRLTNPAQNHHLILFWDPHTHSWEVAMCAPALCWSKGEILIAKAARQSYSPIWALYGWCGQSTQDLWSQPLGDRRKGADAELGYLGTYRIIPWTLEYC